MMICYSFLTFPLAGGLSRLCTSAGHKPQAERAKHEGALIQALAHCLLYADLPFSVSRPVGISGRESLRPVS